MNHDEFIAKVITDSRPLTPQPTTTTNAAHILLWCGLGAWLMAVVVTAAVTFSNRGPAYPPIREREPPSPSRRLGQHPPQSSCRHERSRHRRHRFHSSAHCPLPPAGDLRTYAVLDRRIPFEIRSEAGSNFLCASTPPTRTAS